MPAFRKIVCSFRGAGCDDVILHLQEDLKAYETSSEPNQKSAWDNKIHKRVRVAVHGYSLSALYNQFLHVPHKYKPERVLNKSDLALERCSTVCWLLSQSPHAPRCPKISLSRFPLSASLMVLCPVWAVLGSKTKREVVTG